MLAQWFVAVVDYLTSLRVCYDFAIMIAPPVNDPFLVNPLASAVEPLIAIKIFCDPLGHPRDPMLHA